MEGRGDNDVTARREDVESEGLRLQMDDTDGFDTAPAQSCGGRANEGSASGTLGGGVGEERRG